MGPMEPSLECEGLLGQATALPELPNPLPKLDGECRLFHLDSIEVM